MGEPEPEPEPRIAAAERESDFLRFLLTASTEISYGKTNERPVS